jgi:hypothetical protein
MPPEWTFAVDLIGSYVDCTKHGELVGLPLAGDALRRHFRDAIAFFYETYALNERKCVWGAHTHLVFDHHAERMEELFEGEARYVLLTRHPLDVALSTAEKFDECNISADNIITRINSWCAVASGHLALLAKFPRCRWVSLRYEDVVVGPDECLGDVFTHLGLGRERVARRAFHQKHVGSWGDHKIATTRSVHNVSVGRWKRALPRGTARKVLDHFSHDIRFVEFTRRFGYET